MTQLNKKRNTIGSEGVKAVNWNSDKFFDNQIVGSNWLNTNEAAEYLRTSPNQIRNWVYQGKIEAHRLIGKSLRFRVSELDLLHRKGGHVWE